MRRIAVLSLGLLSLGLVLYAQEGNSLEQNNRRYRGIDGRQGIEKLSLSGTLGLSRGIIVLKSGEEIWYAPGLGRYTGFIEGLKEGALVTLEGWGRRIPQTDDAAGFLMVSKLTLDGKDYEVGPAEPRLSQGPGPWESWGPGHRERRGPPEFQGRERRMDPMMDFRRGLRHHLPEIRRYFKFRTEPKES
jgi:hypothetical protein